MAIMVFLDDHRGFLQGMKIRYRKENPECRLIRVTGDNDGVGDVRAPQKRAGTGLYHPKTAVLSGERTGKTGHIPFTNRLLPGGIP